MIDVISHSTVYSDPLYYSSFPHVVALGDGSVLICFRRAGEMSVAAALAGRPTHHDSNSEIVVLRASLDHQRLRICGETVVKLPMAGVNDPALTILKNGHVLLRFTAIETRPAADRSRLRGQLLAHRTDLGTVSGTLGNYIALSKDRGASFEAPNLIECGKWTHSISRDPVLELRDGTWLLPVYQSNPFSTESSWVIKSFDRGISWLDRSLVAEDPAGRASLFRGVSYNETSVIELANGRLLAIVRADESQYAQDRYLEIGGVGSLKRCYSDNAGLSWSPIEETGIWGQPAMILQDREHSDRTWLTYAIRRPPYGIGLATGDGSGRGFSPSDFMIRSGASFWDFGYPSTCQMENGLFLSCYYWPQADGTRAIEATVWKAK